jgi:Mrp family chromosome partitioning ATPase
VARVLGLPAGGRGLAEALADGGCGLPEIAVQVPGTNLHVAAAAAASRHAFELLRTERLPALLDEARRHYDIVVLDTSPLLLVTDSRVLQGAVDGVLLVVGAHRTPRKLLAEAVDLVDPSKLLGTVFNYDDTPLTAYYGYSGYDGTGRAS